MTASCQDTATDEDSRTRTGKLTAGRSSNCLWEDTRQTLRDSLQQS